MSLAVSTTISTSKLSIRRRWGRRTKPSRSMRVKLVRPSASTLPSPDPEEDFNDAAQLVLMETREASKKRLQGEIGEKLQKIKNRIEDIVRDYSEETKSVTAQGDPEDPEQLFQSLTEPKARSAYYSHLNHCISTCETQCDELENILRHLHETFTESQSGGTRKLLEQAEKDGRINLKEATSVLGGALETAKASVSELVGIKGRMDRLMANLIEFPDTNKGRKKLEKALVQTEDELKNCLQSLEELQSRIKFHSEKNVNLQTQLEVKTKECAKLKESTDEEVKRLKLSKSALEKEVKSLKDEQAEAKTFSKIPVPVAPTTLAPVVADVGKLKELEEALQSEKSKNQELESLIRDLGEKHDKELEAVKAEYEAESKEVRGRFEEQLKSLMEEDDIFQEVDGGGEEYSADATLVEESRTSESPGLIQLESSDINDLSAVVEEPSPVDEQEMIQEEAEVVKKRVTFEESEMDEAELIHASQLEELKKQFAIKENQMKKQMEDNMKKYKGKTKSLQKQLAEAATSLLAKDEAKREAKELQSNLNEMSENLSNALSQTDELKGQLSVMEEENKYLLEKLQLKEEETNKLTEELSNLVSKQTEFPLPRISPVPEVLSLQSSAVMQSQVEILVQPESPVMMSESILPLVATELALDELPDMPPSLEQSVISMDPAPLGSPLGSSPNDRDSMGPNSQHHVPYGLSMLAGSRLSHYSSAPQSGSVSHSHPVMVEWVKAYDLVVKFKDGVISMLKEQSHSVPQLSGLIEELQAIDVHEIDKKADAQNQVVEMRFSLTLMLHQMEQTLQESIDQLSQKLHNSLHSSTQVETEQHGDGPLVNQLREELCLLYNELAIAENRYIAHVDAHKDVIAKLTTRNENLMLEIKQLKSSISMQEKVKVAMFSHVDMKRNTRILTEAANKQLLSDEDFQSVMEQMTEYLSIPASRLMALAQTLISKDKVKRLVWNLAKICSNTRQAANILERIVFMEDEREAKHRSCMAQYGEKRKELACSISNSLSVLEKRIGTPLTKPYFGPPIRDNKGCIVPMNRAMPERHSPSGQYHVSKVGPLASPANTRRSTKTPQPTSSQSQCRNIHTSESIKQSRRELIQKLQQQNMQHQKEELSVKHRATTVDPSLSRHSRTESRRARHRASTATSKLQSSSVCNKSVQPLARTAPSASHHSKSSFTNNQTWNVKSTQRESYLNSDVSGFPFLPKIVEMDLPGNYFVGITHGKNSIGTAVKTDQQNSPSASSLLHTRQLLSSRQAPFTSHTRQTGSTHRQDTPQTNTQATDSALPPIHVPSADPLSVAQ